ncbi:MAG: hypothetical protein WCF03_10090 [Nitrososphaeraceae archaeon]|jgi:hypothetical protein
MRKNNIGFDIRGTHHFHGRTIMIEWYKKGKSRDDEDFEEQEREDEKDPNELKIWESWRKFNGEQNQQ